MSTTHLQSGPVGPGGNGLAEAAPRAARGAPIDGPIRARWNRLGGAGGVLGAARTGDTPCRDGVGHCVHFDHGSIHWTPAIGAFAVFGSIRAKWAALGWEQCAFLGYPLTDETGCPDGVGRFNHFQFGSIYWTPQTGAVAVHGAIRDAWFSLDRERGALGYPTSDEGDLAGGGRVGAFQNGRICWTQARGAWVETGAPGGSDPGRDTGHRSGAA